MATSILSIPVPSFGDGPIVDVSSLVGEKTVSVTGSFRGQYVLLGSHDKVHFIPLLAFDAGGGDGIKLTTRGAVAWVRLRSLALDPSNVRASISGLAIPGSNSFGAFPVLGPGAYGPQPSIDLGLSDFQEGLNFISNGGVVGSVVVEGSLDNRSFTPIGSFSAEPISASLLAAAPLELAPVSTSDRIRYVRLDVQGVILSPFTVTIGGSQTAGGGAGAETLHEAYEVGVSSVDQTLDLHNARGGKVIFDASDPGFTDLEAVQVMAPAGEGAAFLRLGGMVLGPAGIQIGEPGNIALAGGSGQIAIGFGARAIDVNAGFGGQSIAIGEMASATAQAVVIGSQASAAGYDSVDGHQNVAIGFIAVAEGDENVAVGPGTIARSPLGIGPYTNRGCVAIGAYNRAEGNACIVIGFESSAWQAADSLIAIGNEAFSTADQAIAIGKYVYAAGMAAVAIGGLANAYGDNSIALGPLAAVGSLGNPLDDNIAIGRSATVSGGNQSVAMGTTVSVNNSDSIAIGTSASVGSGFGTGSDSIAIGTSASVCSGVGSGSNSIAIGSGARTGPNESGDNVAIGTGANTCDPIGPYSSSGNVAIGQGASATGLGYCTAIGYQAAAFAYCCSIAVGSASSAGGVGTIAIGDTTGFPVLGATASDEGDIAIGSATFVHLGGASASGGDSIAIGSGSAASGGSSIAVGGSSAAAGNSSIAIGNTADSGVGTNNTCIGYLAQVQGAGDFNTCLGNAAQVRNDSSVVVVIGNGAYVDGTDCSNSVVIGASASTLGFASTAVGAGSSVSSDGWGVAVGLGATATALSAIAIGTDAHAGANETVFDMTFGHVQTFRAVSNEPGATPGSVLDLFQFAQNNLGSGSDVNKTDMTLLIRGSDNTITLKPVFLSIPVGSPGVSTLLVHNP